mgnify:CR=1 FL=1
MSKSSGKNQSRHFTPIEVSEQIGIDHEIILELIQREWIFPVSFSELDEEDIARVQLIQELRVRFGANDDSIPLILHLMDQLYYIRHQVSRFGGSK